ncbi:MAG: hypothetical protein EOP48_27105 [Sphingobacteriales bacterium]|nr:MAG: hypothetical protein EOP48_27105 [Sphingobacteriales bacterium]
MMQHHISFNTGDDLKVFTFASMNIAELESFFANIELPDEIQLGLGVKVTDPKLFVETQVNI